MTEAEWDDEFRAAGLEPPPAFGILMLSREWVAGFRAAGLTWPQTLKLVLCCCADPHPDPAAARAHLDRVEAYWRGLARTRAR